MHTILNYLALISDQSDRICYAGYGEINEQSPENVRYHEFTLALLRKEYQEPKELAEQTIKGRVNNVGSSYIELVDEILAKVENKLTKDEVVGLISKNMPEVVKRGLVESLHTLKAAGTQLTPMKALALADNMRSMMAETVTEEQNRQANKPQFNKQKKQFDKHRSPRQSPGQGQNSASQRTPQSNAQRSSPAESTQSNGQKATRAESRTWLCKSHRRDKKAPAEECKRSEHCNYKRFQSKVNNVSKPTGNF